MADPPVTDPPTTNVVRATESTFLVSGADKDLVPVAAEPIPELVARVYEPGSIPHNLMVPDQQTLGQGQMALYLDPEEMRRPMDLDPKRAREGSRPGGSAPISASGPGGSAPANTARLYRSLVG